MNEWSIGISGPYKSDFKATTFQTKSKIFTSIRYPDVYNCLVETEWIYMKEVVKFYCILDDYKHFLSRKVENICSYSLTTFVHGIVEASQTVSKTYSIFHH